ncbi:MAG: hypothetical protein LBJ61_03725 [Deltaproteobacteria bacterium]|nr:hypothetical protein [Deltaproteobacteria bacterium]
MMVSKDMDMFAPAYVAPGDDDGDGRMDVGFNPAVEYTGIFDPYSCYTYVAKQDNASPSETEIGRSKDYTRSGDDPTLRGHFVRVGPSVPDKPDAIGFYPDANRLPKEIRDGYDDSANGRPGFPAPKSKTGICPGKDRTSGTEHTDRPGKNMKNLTLAGNARIWSGNWLNWMTSSRLDVVRQVLYGGKRVLDLPGMTYLTVEWIPENASVWAYDDFTKYFWLDYNEGSAYYDTSNYTPVSNDRWSGHYRRLHSYGRVQNRLWLIDSIWFMRQKEDVTNHEGFRSFSAYYVPKYRNQYTPLDFVLNSFADNYKTDDVEVVVEACRPLTKKEVVDFYNHIDTSRPDPAWVRPTKEAQVSDDALLEKGDYCQRYGSGFKPTGLLQKYAELDQALFGLFTGAFSNVNRWDAGFLRQNVTSIRHQISSSGTYNGTVANNVFKMFDSIVQLTKPRLDPWNEKRTAIDTELRNRRMGWADPLQSNFGNPIGEMLYAGLLYFAKNTNSNYSYWPTGMDNTELIDLPRLGSSSYAAWQSPLFSHGGDCLKPVILLLSSTSPSHDGDTLPGTPHGIVSGLGGTPRLNLNFVEEHMFHNQAGLSKIFNMSQILGTMTTLEGLTGKRYYIANTNTGAAGAVVENGISHQYAADGDTNLCVPRVLNNLADVRGLCPAAPQTYGTYAVAAAAYYGNTHDFDGSSNKVQTFAVALPSIFPKINLESRGRIISVSPIAMSITHPCGRNDGDPRFCKNGDTKPYGIQYLGPFTTSIIQWRADDDGRVYSGAVFAGFNGRLEGEGEDYQLDAPVRYYFDLIRECYPGECVGGPNPSALVESFRYNSSHSGHSGHPSRDDERDATFAFINQAKYLNKYYTTSEMSTSGASGTRCNSSNRDKISGCGSAKERLAMQRILADFKDGRYAAAPFKRHREWVYKNWDHAGRPNYILSGERPKNYRIAAYMPKRWSQLPGHFIRPVAELTTYYDPDPALMQSYARAIYPWVCGTSTNAPYSSSGCNARRDLVNKLPGAAAYKDPTSNDNYDTVQNESASLFIDRPFQEIGYEEVMDVYGYIGDPGHIYKKVGKPDEIDDAIGVAVFMYSLFEEIDNSDRAYPINIGYYTHGGLSYPSSKADNPSRTLTDAEGTYIEIQNEHNYMGGSPINVNVNGINPQPTTGQEKGLMTIAHPLNTPPTCYQPGQALINEPMNFLAAEVEPKLFKNGVPGNAMMPGYITDTNATPHSNAVPTCGSARLPLTATRLFRFPSTGSMDPPDYLPDPLWLAAKYGGFNDENRNGIPEKNEYDILPAPNGDGIPDNYFYANNLTELKDKLSEAFERIMSSMNVGTATSASVNSVLGGGITVRTYYQSIHTPTSAPETPEIRWLGGTYALFIDLWGNMREDTNQNGRLDLNCGFDGDANSLRNDNSKGDYIIEFVDCSRLDSSEFLACANARDESDIKTVARIYPDMNGKNLKGKTSSRAVFKTLEDVRMVWNLSRNLSDLTDSNALSPRDFGVPATSKRRVYFHQDGVTPPLPTKLSNNNLFYPTGNLPAQLAKYLWAANATDATRLMSYVLGVDQTGYRSRRTVSPWFNLNKGKTITCRLGDVINSQPIIVGSPFSGYDILYADKSYALYKAEHKNRRHLAVVGANDGMLHAINMGRPISLKDGYNGYTESVTGAMGREMWAFIPQSLLPHLQWLQQIDYAHAYYMDMTPTVVEVKNSSGQWKTILISSLRFGGRAIELNTTPASYSYSEVFALDITDPDQEPTLLWRFSHPQMGLVVAKPTVVRNTASGDHWYVIVASGPTYDTYVKATDVTVPLNEQGRRAYQGHSNQSAKLFVFDALSGPGTGNAQVTTVDTYLPKSFITNFQVLNAFKKNVTQDGDDVSWSNSLAYFSVNQSAPDTELLCLANASQTSSFLDSNNGNDFCGTSKYGNYGYLDKGSVWRLNMANASGAPIDKSGWQNNFKLFFNSERPVSAAVNTLHDGENLWVLFGSGRYWSEEDSRLCEGQGDTKECRLNHVNYIYGIKDKVSADGDFAFSSSPISESSLVDVSNVVVYPDASILAKDSNGTYGPAKVGAEFISDYGTLAAKIKSSSYNGYRRALKTNSENYVDATEPDSPGDEQFDGSDWWEGLSYEMVIHQMAATHLFGRYGSVIAFSTFLPQSVSCGSIGISFAMITDAYTGLPKPDFSELAFQNINNFQAYHAPANSGGLQAVSDHVYSVNGLSAQTIFVMTGTNEQKSGQFETVNSDGTVTVIKLPEEAMPKGGVLSWREVLDFSTIGVE